MENRPNKEKRRQIVNKSNKTAMKTALKKIRTEGNSPELESTIRRVGKKICHANKINRLVSRSVCYYRSKNEQ